MPFAIPPHIFYRLIDVSVPKLILGNKESNPSAWRVLTDLLSGKTKRPQKKTLDTIFILAGASKGISLSEMAQSIPDGLPWEMAAAAHSAGRKLADPAYDPVADVPCAEAVRMEKLAFTALQAAKKENDFGAALDHISRWEMCDLPSLQWVLGNIDTGNQDSFVATSSPLVITGTLYLMACGVVEYFGTEVPEHGISIIPQRRDGVLIRPMTRWLETLKAHRQFKTNRQLSDFLLYPRSEDENIDDLRRVFRDWWSKGKIPPWSRVPHIIHSVATHDGQELRQDISDGIYPALIMIRLMDKLLTASLEIQARWLPEYDPLAPFQDIRLMRERAVAAKLALSPQAEQ